MAWWSIEISCYFLHKEKSKDSKSMHIFYLASEVVELSAIMGFFAKQKLQNLSRTPCCHPIA
jgi:hypothetical protein